VLTIGPEAKITAIGATNTPHLIRFSLIRFRSQMTAQIKIEIRLQCVRSNDDLSQNLPIKNATCAVDFSIFGLGVTSFSAILTNLPMTTVNPKMPFTVNVRHSLEI